MVLTDTFTPRNFRGQSHLAARDARLRAILDHATRYFMTKRGVALEAFADREDHFGRARVARLAALSRLPELLERLERNATAAGTRVHWARDAAQAREIVAGIARDCGAKVVVKGKSMVSEEIALNPALEATGAEVWETDLGEFIVQLAQEPPSHIIAPCIHMSRADVAALFREKLGLADLADAASIPELTLLARRALREKFLAADLGVTGVNMAVAETGSVVLVENEGNIRMSTTCPPVHVAIMSLEKVAATLEDAADLLRVLPRSATGQRMSSYVSVLTGPRRTEEPNVELDGPRETHLVILDNGRAEVLADPVLREALLCFRCGACLNSCPVYQTVGGHAYGSVYSGPIGTLLSSLLLPTEDTRDLPFGCTLCGACKKTCPLGIDHPKLMLRLRERVCAGSPGLAGVAHAFLALHPLAYRLAVGAARAVDPGLNLLPRLPGLPVGLASFVDSRQPPRLKTPFSAQLRRSRKKGGA
ncbi:MAG: lactate utilization protein B [Humidesulfovibrio sp.]|uniref:lactate utilization protein B n=1 Tax=Humidesulfovibrio sp. TaxID=2910988 RepID=UPI0027F1FBAB|nr:lactate utilization protein B [Humidesulfovibrio sp.]MDQ7834237.1 lactate utilization protein B [Humidesulfovibrio sp.]